MQVPIHQATCFAAQVAFVLGASLVFNRSTKVETCHAQQCRAWHVSTLRCFALRVLHAVFGNVGFSRSVQLHQFLMQFFWCLLCASEHLPTADETTLQPSCERAIQIGSYWRPHKTLKPLFVGSSQRETDSINWFHSRSSKSHSPASCALLGYLMAASKTEWQDSCHSSRAATAVPDPERKARAASQNLWTATQKHETGASNNIA